MADIRAGPVELVRPIRGFAEGYSRHRLGGPAETKPVLPSITGSWGAMMRDAKHDRFFLDLRSADGNLKKALGKERRERFIGVIYRPETERLSRYADASLGNQFDAYIWIETTKAVEQLSRPEVEVLPKSHPFSM